jgi:hypothetical protein
LDKEKASRRRTFIYFYILLALLTLLVAASYTWFSISQTPRVSEMDLYVTTQSGLELSATYGDEEDTWGQTLNFEDVVSESSPLKPVTWSEEQQTLLAIRYGFDGRMTGDYEVLTDEANANRTDGNGYYVVGTFYLRSDQYYTVSLADAVEVNGGENGAGTYVIGTPIWNSNTLLHDNGGHGAETAIRLGFLLTKVSTGNTSEPDGSSVFYLYEPNCDQHIDGSTEYVATPSIDGTDTLAEHLILQTASGWTEADPVQRKVTIKELGEFQSDTTLFTIQSGEVYQCKLYIWLEGQDIDCTNSIDEAQILANIQFSTTNQGGLKPIPNE